MNRAKLILLELIENRRLMTVFLHFLNQRKLRKLDIQKDLLVQNEELSAHLSSLVEKGIAETYRTEFSLTALGKEVARQFLLVDGELRVRAAARMAEISTYSTYSVRQVILPLVGTIESTLNDRVTATTSESVRGFNGSKVVVSSEFLDKETSSVGTEKKSVNNRTEEGISSTSSVVRRTE